MSNIRLNLRFSGSDEDAQLMRYALEQCARAVIDEHEAGQRGARLNPMIEVIATAYIANGEAAVWLMRELKRVASEAGDYASPCFTDGAKMEARRLIFQAAGELKK